MVTPRLVLTSVQRLHMEQRIITALLTSEEDRIVAFELEGLQPYEFKFSRNSAIVRAIRALHEAPQPVDALTVAQYIESSGGPAISQYVEALAAERNLDVRRDDIAELRSLDGLRGLM